MFKKKKCDKDLLNDDIINDNQQSEIFNDNQTKKKNKKKNENKFIKLIKGVSFKNLNTTIKGYGYNFNLKNYIIQMMLFLIIIVVAGKIYLLEPIYIFILAVSAIICLPIIIVSRFYTLYNNQRFQNLVNYMSKMIIFFKQEPKIMLSLQKTRKYVDSTTQKKIDKALEILNNDSSLNRYEKALEVISDEYKSSRIATLHRFMITVEEKSSKNYRNSLTNLDYDIKEWINRVYEYQINLKTKKAQVMISLIGSLVLLSIFSVMWVNVNDLAHIIENPVYQIGSLLFLFTSLIMFTLSQTKINGQWLVEDYTGKEYPAIKRKIYLINNYSYKKSLKKQIPKIVIFLLLCIYCIVVKEFIIAGVLGAIMAYMFYEPHQMQKSRIKSVGKAISIEFPLWLRDVALNLNNYVVIEAIKHSKTFVSDYFEDFLDEFLKEVEEDPVSIAPFQNFLKKYELSDVETSMLALYSLQHVSEKDSEREVNDLIIRNQMMLANSEKFRNQNALIGVLVVSFIPVITTMIKILVDMFTMLFGIFANMF